MAAGRQLAAESYVNLIPTAQGRHHVNGLRSGLTTRCASSANSRSLLPRAASKLAPEDVWDRLCFDAVVEVGDPQFSSPKTKAPVLARDAAGFVENAVRRLLCASTSTSTSARRSAQLAIERATLCGSRPAIVHKKLQGPPRSKLADCASSDLSRTELFPGRGRLGRRQRARRARGKGLPGHPAAARRSLNTWEVDSGQVLSSPGSARPRGHDRLRPGQRTTCPACATARW